MVDLPVARFQIHKPPFFYVGVDSFGPLSIQVKKSKAKRYECLFTCMITRLTHLKLAQNMSSSLFINALKRFKARHRPSKHIYSNNDPNFIGTNKFLKKIFQVKKTKQSTIICSRTILFGPLILPKLFIWIMSGKG